MKYNDYGYKLEEELGEGYYIDFIYNALSKRASTDKIVAMNSAEFLQNIDEAAKTATSVSASLDELNDMLEVTVDGEHKVIFTIAIPRVPQNEYDEMLLAVVDSGEEALARFADSFLKTELSTEVPLETAELEADYSNDELEEMATQLDKMASLVANNAKEAYAIELAAYSIRELKRVI